MHVRVEHIAHITVGPQRLVCSFRCRDHAKKTQRRPQRFVFDAWLQSAFNLPLKGFRPGSLSTYVRVSFSLNPC